MCRLIKPRISLTVPPRYTVISSSLQWSSCVLLSERSRRNALAHEAETSWIPECGALQESPESPTWTRSRFPWQRRANRRKHWGNPVILQHWPIINTQSGEGSRSWYASNPYRALGRRTSNQNRCCSRGGCMVSEKSRSLRAAAEYTNFIFFSFVFLTAESFIFKTYWRSLIRNIFVFYFFLYFSLSPPDV